MGSPSAIITLGFGNGTFAGSPSLIVTLGYGVGEAVAPTASANLFGKLTIEPQYRGKLTIEPQYKGSVKVE